MASRSVHGICAAALVGALFGCGDLLETGIYAVEPTERNTCGALEIPVDGGCERVGVTDCGDGFVSDDEGGCIAVLPDAACAPAQLAYPGRTQCGRVGNSLPCLSTTDPKQLLPNYASATRHVWGDAPSGGDGSRDAPHATIGEAIAAASAGEVILVSPGTYRESVVIDKPLSLRGVCAEDVHITTDENAPSVTVRTGSLADVTELVALDIGGQGDGVLVEASAARIHDTWIHGTVGRGVTLIAGDTVIEDSLLEDLTGTGIRVIGGALNMRRSAIRDVHEDVDRLELGRALSASAHRHGAAPSPAVVAIDQVLIERAHDAAIHVEGSRGTITRTAIRDMLLTQRAEEVGLPQTGAGIVADLEPARFVTGSVTVEQVVIDGAWGAGLRAFGADLDVRQTTVRGTRAAAPPCRAHALRAIGSITSPSHVKARNVAFSDSRATAVHILGASATLAHALIRDTAPEPCGDDMGDGVAIYAQPDETARLEDGARLEVTRSRISGSARAAALSVGGVLVLDATLLSDNATHVMRSGYAPSDALVPTAPIVTLQGRTRCGDADVLRSCDILDDITEPDLFPRNADGRRAAVIGIGSELGDALTGVPNGGALAWVRERDEVPAAVSDSFGRWVLRGVPAQQQLVFNLATRDFHGSSLVIHTRGVSFAPPANALLPLFITTEAFPDVLGAPLDFAGGFVWADTDGEVLVSDPPPAFPPAFILDGSPTFDPSPQTSDAFLLGLPSSVVTIRFEDAFGTPLECSLDAPALTFGLPSGDSATARMPAFPGVMMRFSPSECRPGD